MKPEIMGVIEQAILAVQNQIQKKLISVYLGGFSGWKVTHLKIPIWIISNILGGGVITMEMYDYIRYSHHKLGHGSIV